MVFMDERQRTKDGSSAGEKSSVVTYLTWVWTYNLYHEETEA